MDTVQQEFDRIMQEYQNGNVCWPEFVDSIKPNPELSITDIVCLYAKLTKEIDGDIILRINTNDDICEQL